jgi:hypothetical protein
MKRLIASIIVLFVLLPSAGMAGPCTLDKRKFCKDVIAAQGDVNACLKQHESELSKACKAKTQAKAEKPPQDQKPTEDK